jgi:HTH-type transcriptional regulator/antitoxin HigA
LLLGFQRVRGLTRISDPNEWSSHLTEWCREAGVVVVFERELPKARIIGAVRWFPVPNEQADKALVQFSLRHAWSDIFWFTFFHEAGHLLLHDRKRLTLMDERDADKLTFIEAGTGDNILEREADDFASRTLVPREFEHRLRDLSTEPEIQQFAEELGIATGIVVGRLQHDGLLQYREMNHLRPRFKWVDIDE